MENRVLQAIASLLLLWALLIPSTARAENVRAGCWAATNGSALDGQPTLPPTDRWVCDRGSPSNAPGTAWLFFTPEDFAQSEEAPSHFITDIGRFDRIVLIAMNADGPVRWRSYGMGDVHNFVNGPRFALPAPDMMDATGLVVAVERPWSPVMLSQARMVTRDGASGSLGWSTETMLVIAVLVGMLAAPLAYNIAFYRILRERFVLWMLGTQVSMLAFTLVSSGMAQHVLPMSLSANLFLSSITLLAPSIFGVGFFLAYVESEILEDTMRKLMMGTAIATALVGAVFCLPLPFLRPMAHMLFVLAPIPLLIVMTAGCITAYRAGSNAVRFQIAAWTAIAISGFAVMARSMGFGVINGWPDTLLYLAVAAHAAIMSVAVMYRVDILRRDRERVNARIESLTNLIDLDPLTGIFNRRALEQRFAELRSDGFHALAVVDLDHFKRINDRFGHTTGDRVLQEVAAVLGSDKDAIAFRMGGEEFVVMLRGPQIQQRAEQLRRAITIRIANEVDGIDGPVTASMGLIESPPGGASTMRQLYSQADRLLYEAKYSGRNRLITERIQIFAPPSKERRQKDRRAAERRAG